MAVSAEPAAATLIQLANVNNEASKFMSAVW